MAEPPTNGTPVTATATAPATTLDPDTIDDILYLSRTGETEELIPLIQSLSLPEARVLGAAVDPVSGNSALHMAVANGHVDTLEYLLTALGGTSLGLDQDSHLEARHEAPSSTSTSISVPPLLLNHRNDAGNTPLHWAAVNGQLEAVQLLVKAGADCSAKNAKGHEAAFEAEAAGRDDVVAFLLSVGKGEGREEEADAEAEAEAEAGGEVKMDGVEDSKTNGVGKEG